MGGIGLKLGTGIRFKLIDGLNQPDRADLDEILNRVSRPARQSISDPFNQRQSRLDNRIPERRIPALRIIAEPGMHLVLTLICFSLGTITLSLGGFFCLQTPA